VESHEFSDLNIETPFSPELVVGFLGNGEIDKDIEGKLWSSIADNPGWLNDSRLLQDGFDPMWARKYRERANDVAWPDSSELNLISRYALMIRFWEEMETISGKFDLWRGGDMLDLGMDGYISFETNLVDAMNWLGSDALSRARQSPCLLKVALEDMKTTFLNSSTFDRNRLFMAEKGVRGLWESAIEISPRLVPMIAYSLGDVTGDQILQWNRDIAPKNIASSFE
jgi:hypothetical protein